MLLKEESDAKSAPSTTGDWAKTGLRSVLMLAVVLVLAYLTIMALKWLSDRRESPAHSSKDLQLMDTLKLSPGSSVHLINVRGKTLLIGSTAGQINLLSEVESIEESEVAPEKDKRFAEYLDKYYNGSKNAGPATRVAGLLRDATAHIQGRQPHAKGTGRANAGENDES